MSAKPPPIPAEQQRIPGEKPHIDNDRQERRDATTGLQSGQPGDADVNLKEQGRQGGVHQNITHQGRQQDR
jgi:hypothetical protein